MGAAAIVTAATTAISIIQQQAQARSQQRLQQAATNRQIEQQQLQQSLREKHQRDQSKQQQATARAAFGARGVSSADGSGDAVVGGIGARTEEAIADDRQLLDLGIENLRANQRDQQRANLLETRNSILSTIVNTAGKQYLAGQSSGAFGTGNHPGEQ